MLRLLDVLLIDFWQTIDIVVGALDAEVLCQIDNLHILRDGMLLEECLALAMTKAEEHNVYLVQRHLVSELQIGIADQSFVDI